MAQSQESGEYVAVDDFGERIGGPFDTAEEAWDWISEGGNGTAWAVPVAEVDALQEDTTRKAKLSVSDPFAPVQLEEDDLDDVETIGQIAGVCECGAERPFVVNRGPSLWKACCGRAVYA